MKARGLFSMVMIAMVSNLSAQSLPATEQNHNPIQKIKINSSRLASKQSLILSGNTKENVMTRANGISYNTPEGAFWMGINYVGEGWGAVLHLPAWTSIEYQNSSSNPASTKWYVNGNLQDNVVNNNLIAAYRVNAEARSFYLPTITNASGSISFTLGAGKIGRNSGIMTRGSEETILTTAQIPEDGFFTGLQGGGYVYGSDLKSAKGEIMNLISIVHPKPISPLWVSNIYYPILSKSNTPIAEGSKMTLRIKKARTNANGVLVPTDEVLFEMTAENAVEGFAIDKNNKVYMLAFSNKIKDPITGTMVDEPFVLNEAFALELSGFDQPGIDIGLFGSSISEGDNMHTFLQFPSEAESLYSYDDMNAPVMITGFFNVISISEQTTTLKAPDNGGRAYTENGMYDFAAIFTTLEWSEDNFWYDTEMPEWIRIGLDDSEREGDGGYYALNFDCDPLPADETSRSWTFNLQSFGATADQSITIYQGIKPSGIDKTNANNEVKIVSTTDAYILSYPENVTNVSIVNVAGQTIATYELPAGGKFTVPAAELSRGLYLLKFNNNQTVKVIK